MSPRAAVVWTPEFLSYVSATTTRSTRSGWT